SAHRPKAAQRPPEAPQTTSPGHRPGGLFQRPRRGRQRGAKAAQRPPAGRQPLRGEGKNTDFE
ncbi:hypothetical protein EU316_24770, partial [Salmonella enterica subsp. enterica serovar Braenderup]|nr:hypothetical protein [Salmonella enterica subsp. enterica serovar Braenderup]